MRNLPLNQSRVDRLKPRNSTYDIRDTDLKGFGIRNPAFGQEKLLPANAIRRLTPLDKDRRCRRFGRSRGPVASANLVGRPQERAGECPRTAGRDRFRGGRRRGFLLLPEALETAHARCQRELLREPYSAMVQGAADCRHYAARGARMVRVALCEAGLGEPIPAGAIGHPAAGRGVRIPARGQQSLQRHQALPSPCAGTLPVAGRNSPRRRGSEPE